MRRTHDTVTDLDILAYADGLLDGDAARKAIVDTYLAKTPEAARFVEDIREQNIAIRKAYAGALTEPVPERLLGALDEASQPRTSPALRAASMAALVVVAALGGWIVAQQQDQSRLLPAGFIEEVKARHDTGRQVALQDTAMEAATPPLGWLRQTVSLEFEAPDLSGLGYMLVGKQRTDHAGNSAVRLIYRGADDSTINLFLRPRWEPSGQTMARIRDDNVTVHYWLHGPLAFALTSDPDNDKASELAYAIHEATTRPRPSEPDAATALETQRSGYTTTGDQQSDGMPGTNLPVIGNVDGTFN